MLSKSIKPLTARDSEEAHRAATPLELLFDLVSVIAIAAAAAGLHHAIAGAHASEGLIIYLVAFFAIWWAWMNYTWFASAYDNDDALFRVVTFVIMGGSLTMAAGIAPLFDSFDLRPVVVGYVIMRLGMIALWIRAARHDPERRPTAIAYAVGIGIIQCLWVGFLLLQPLSPAVSYSLVGLFILLELAVPAVAEKKSNTPWHRHHIIERYGLLNIIVLGETLLSTGFALKPVVAGTDNIAFLHIALSSLVIVFSLWWLYFSKEDHLDNNTRRRAFTWGYGHFVIFASGAAVGAGFAVLVDIVAGKSEISLLAGSYAVAIPVAIYLIGLWFVRDRFCLTGLASFTLPVFAIFIVLVPLTPFALQGIAVLTALSVVARSFLQ